MFSSKLFTVLRSTAKTLVMANDKRHISRLLQKIKEELKVSPSTILIVTSNLVLKPNTFPPGVECRDFKEYEPWDGNEQPKVQDWIKEWSSKKIINNRNFKELLTYRGVSLWWFIEFYYLYQKYMRQISEYIGVLEKIRLRENPARIIFAKDSSLFSRVLAAFSESRNIEKSEVQVDWIGQRIRSRVTRFLVRNYSSFLAMKRMVRSKWASLLNATLSLESSKDRDSKSIAVISTERDWRFVLDPQSSKRRGFIWVHPLLELLRERRRIVLISLGQWEIKPGLRTLFEEKLSYPYSTIRTSWSWYTRDVKNSLKRGRSWLNSVWVAVNSHQEFKRSLNYHGIQLWNVLGEMFYDVFCRVLPEAIRSIEIVRIMIRKEKPVSIILPCEYCTDFGYASLAMGRQARVRTIALQHGIIAPSSFEYKFTREEAGEGKSNSKLAVVPERFAAYGDATRKTLRRLLYPAGNIVATGSPQYDTQLWFEKSLHRDIILKELKVDPSKRIVTLTTQPIPTMGLLIQIALKAIESLQDVILIVKPHPAESMKLYEGITRRMKGVNTVVLRPDYNTIKALHVCDIAITSFSTTALEAMMLNKPVINISVRKNDSSFYAREGPSKTVATSEELNREIFNLLTDDNLRRNLLHRQKLFISKQMYRIDGKSSERVIALINRRDRRATKNAARLRSGS